MISSSGAELVRFFPRFARQQPATPSISVLAEVLASIRTPTGAVTISESTVWSTQQQCPGKILLIDVNCCSVSSRRSAGHLGHNIHCPFVAFKLKTLKRMVPICIYLRLYVVCQRNLFMLEKDVIYMALSTHRRVSAAKFNYLHHFSDHYNQLIK